MSEDRDQVEANEDEAKDEDVEAHRKASEESVDDDGDDDVEAHRHRVA
jgi:hypothetical protein